MIRVHLLVEGQTEEAFVNELLVPHYARQSIFLDAIIVETRSGYKGGIISYAKTKPQILRLCKQDQHAYVSTLFDLYALPQDFPGKADPAYKRQKSGAQKAQFLEQALANDINQPRFLPNLLVHEFEALLFTDLSAFKLWTDDDTQVDTLIKHTGQHAPEDINDTPETAPSKRILHMMPTYQKTFHGPLIAIEIGLDRIRRACPHFDAWLKRIEQISKPT